MRVLTFATDETPGLHRFRRSCALHGLTPEVIGLGGPYTGHVYRLQKMYPLLHRMDPAEIVLFADGYDCVIASSETDILARFADLHEGRVVFGAEVECHPDWRRADEWPHSNTPYRYLNAGCWIGRAGDVVRLWEHSGVIQVDPRENDQGVLGAAFLKNTDLFRLDTSARLFQNLYAATDHVDFATGINRHTGQKPCVFHASGGADLTRANAYALEGVLAVKTFEESAASATPKPRRGQRGKISVLVCTAISEGKEYVRPFLAPMLRALGGAAEVLFLVDGGRIDEDFAEELRRVATVQHLSHRPGNRYERLAEMREACRQYFLESQHTHLYFHDCDMIVPLDIIPRLLAHNASIVSGIYNRRNTNLVSPPLWGKWWEKLAEGSESQILPTVGEMAVEGFGMGCMLIRRDVLRAVSFRAGEAGEDWAFAQDCKDKLGVPTILDPSLSCWHVSPDGSANRLRIEEKRTAVVWTDTPHYVTKRWGGAFEHCVPRFDVPSDVIPTLGPGFVSVDLPGMSVEVEPVHQIMAREMLV